MTRLFDDAHSTEKWRKKGFYPLLEEEKTGQDIESMRSEEDYAELISRYGTRRNATWFWELSDRFNEYNKAHYPLEAGLFDLNRYENR